MCEGRMIGPSEGFWEPEPKDDRAEIDLGDGHFMRFFRWAPDDLPANKERYGTPLPVVEKAGVTIRHSAKEGSGNNGDGTCVSAVHFDLPDLKKAGLGEHVWRVEQWELLTLSPSLLCMTCGDHGLIREGKWVRA